MNDPRVEAAAKAITTRYGDPVRRWKQDIDDATVALAAADAADREQGIHRVRVDDATVERVARDMAETLGHGWAFENDHSSKYATRQRFIDAARAVLAALIGAES